MILRISQATNTSHIMGTCQVGIVLFFFLRGLLQRTNEGRERKGRRDKPRGLFVCFAWFDVRLFLRLSVCVMFFVRSGSQPTSSASQPASESAKIHILRQCREENK